MTIAVQSLRKEFSVASGIEVAVDDVDLEVEEGEFVSIVGPSGCGKTTTLRCLAGLETPTRGEVQFDGHDVTDVPAHKRRLAMMFQNIALYPHMTTRENIAYPLKVEGVRKSQRDEEAERAAEIMQIRPLLDKHPGELSGGQRQRAALARTIVQDPQAFLMDEPLSDLDAKLKVEIRKEIQRVHRRVEKPTLYVTHDQEEAMTMSDRIVVLNDGAVEQRGTPDELYRQPVNVFVAGFIGNPSMNFLDGRVVERDEDAVTLSVADTRLSIDVRFVGGEVPGDAVTVGFRPEVVEIHDDVRTGDFTGHLSLVERIGDRLLATIDRDDGEIQATVPADHSLTEQTDVSFSFEPSRTHVFDRASGDVVARGR